MIRKASAEDFEIVRSIVQKTILAVYPHYYPAGAVAFFLAHHSDAAIERDISESRVFLYISDEGHAVGTVTVTGNDIGRLFVLPEYQGHGYGGALLTFAEQTAAKSFHTVILDASLPAKAIYLKRGYETAVWHVIETENGDFLCFDEMTRRLKPENIAFQKYQRVKMKDDRYASDGIHAGDIGTVLEIYDDTACEVEFSRPDGTTYALQAIRMDNLILLDD